MRNRAKCRKCKSVIESLTLNDHVSCSCGEISISGGLYESYVSTLNYDNFLRVDDENNEIIVKVIESEGPHETEKKPDHDELLAMLDRMIDSYSSLPENAMSTPITHYDFVSALMLLSSIVKRIP